jgi:hypothetical protein
MHYGAPFRVMAVPDYLRRDSILAGTEVVDLTEVPMDDIQVVSQPPVDESAQRRNLLLVGIPLVLIGIYAIRGVLR